MRSLLAYSSVLYFSANKSYFSYNELMPEYFTVFGATVSGIAFLISCSVCSVVVHRNTSGFCIAATLQPYGMCVWTLICLCVDALKIFCI